LKRVVIDASILLSTLVGHPEAPPAMLLNAVYDRIVEAIGCPYLIEEVRDNLRENPYFSARIDDTEARRAIARIERAVTMFADPVNPEPIIS
jgi:predicted nucleic acid-binding protein